MKKQSGSVKEKRFAKAFLIVGCIMVAFLVAIVSYVNFRDSHIVQSGVKVTATIQTVQNDKNMSSGWIDYRLLNGANCRDWAELAPKGVVHPGDKINVFIDRACGHPVSEKKPNHPWYYLSISFAVAAWMIYCLRKLNKNDAAHTLTD